MPRAIRRARVCLLRAESGAMMAMMPRAPMMSAQDARESRELFSFTLAIA